MTGLTPFDKTRGASDFFAPIAYVRREIDRLFDQANTNDWTGLADRNIAGLRMDVAETDKEIVVTAELPGVDIKDVDVSLAEGVLTIKGEKRSERDEKRSNFHLVERSFGAFERRIGVPDSCDPEQVKAEFSNGVLTVTVPRPASAAPAAKIKITKN
jgi:HSP20 family protein